MYDLFSLHCADFSVGRVDKSTLSQQTLMELMIENMTNTEEIAGAYGNRSDISEWNFVKFNAVGEVVRITWGFKRLGGSIDVQWMPDSVEDTNVVANTLVGSIDLTKLPEKLKKLWVSMNMLSEGISLEELPKCIQTLSVTSNRLTGSIILTKLPETTKSLFLSKNNFSGSIDLTRLPSKLVDLRLNQNPIKGETDFTKIPISLQNLDVSSTDISGTICQAAEERIRIGHSNVKVER